MARRLIYYAGASTAAAAACLLKAFHERPNFYSAAVYLSHSNACILILTNLILVTACWFLFGLQRLLYGPLRPIEIEQLSEKAWYAVLDTLLAMPSFREDVGGWLLTMFGLLLAGKVWGWIAEGRVDILEQQPPANPRLFHARLATSLLLSVGFDLYMLHYCCDTVIKDPRPGMMVIFTFEFAILSIFSFFTLYRYVLNVVDTRIQKRQLAAAIEARKLEIMAERAAARQTEEAGEEGTAAQPTEEEPIEVDENEVDVPGWEDKRRYLFAMELFTDFVKLLIYIFFFAASVTFNGLPMHIMRDVYMTFVSFSKRVTDYLAYRKATSDMNSRYPDATVEEIQGDVCIICRETMLAWSQANAPGENQPGADQPAQAAPARRLDEGLRAKKLPCGHILHLRCLKAWLERQQVCPTCRRPVVSAGSEAANNGGAANNAQPNPGGQQPAQPQARPPRLFGIGAVRIGFLRGPQEQVQNIINQIQNPNDRAAHPEHGNAAGIQGQAQPAGAGPNHLGLAEPYAGNQNVLDGATAHLRAQQTVPHIAQAANPLQLQLMQLQERLMAEAQNLGLQQQQLNSLRAMEAELVRLRAQRTPTPGTPFVPGSLAPGSSAGSSVLSGSYSHQMGSGNESLPEGLVLPEGWTLMPLHPAAPSAFPQAPAFHQPMHFGNAASPTPTANGIPMVRPSSTPVTPSQPPPVSQVPVNATQPAAAESRPSPQPQAAASPAAKPASEDVSRHAAAATAPSAPPPWSGGNGWNFGTTSDHASNNTANETAAISTQTNSDDAAATPPTGEQNGSYKGKGKGKAVEVEEVDDPEA